MTPEEINTINRQIAKWIDEDATKTCTKCFCNHFNNPCTYDCPEYNPADFYNSDSYAVILLPAIARHPSAYYWKAHYNPFTKTNTFEIYHNALKCATAFDKQFSAAICQAVIQVIRKEKEQ